MSQHLHHTNLEPQQQHHTVTVPISSGNATLSVATVLPQPIMSHNPAAAAMLPNTAGLANPQDSINVRHQLPVNSVSLPHSFVPTAVILTPPLSARVSQFSSPTVTSNSILIGHNNVVPTAIVSQMGNAPIATVVPLNTFTPTLVESGMASSPMAASSSVTTMRMGTQQVVLSANPMYSSGPAGQMVGAISGLPPGTTAVPVSIAVNVTETLSGSAFSQLSSITTNTSNLGGGGLQPRGVGMNEALQFLDILKMTYGEDRPEHQEFMQIMKDFQDRKIDTHNVVQRVQALFGDHKEILEHFSTFLPRPPTQGANANEGNSGIAFSSLRNMSSIAVVSSGGQTGPLSTVNTATRYLLPVNVQTVSTTCSMLSPGSSALQQQQLHPQSIPSQQQQQQTLMSPVTVTNVTISNSIPPGATIVTSTAANVNGNSRHIMISHSGDRRTPSGDTMNMVPGGTTRHLITSTSTGLALSTGLNAASTARIHPPPLTTVIPTVPLAPNVPSGGSSSSSPPPTLPSDLTSSIIPNQVDEEDGNLKTAMDFVMNIMERFRDQPQRYNQFIEALRHYNTVLHANSDPAAHKKADFHVRTKVRHLFQGEEDLIDGFDKFLRQTTSASGGASLGGYVHGMGSTPGGSNALIALSSSHNVQPVDSARRPLVMDSADPGSHHAGPNQFYSGISRAFPSMSGILNSRPTTESGLSDGLNKRGRNLTKLSSPALLHITDEMSAAMDSSKQKIWKDVLKSYENGVLDSGDVISRAQEFLPNQKRLLNALKNYFVTERETYEAEEDDDDDDMDDDDDDEDDDDDMDDAILEQDDLDNEDDEDINSCVDDDMDDNTQPSISARASSLTRIDIDFLQQQQQHHIGNMEEGLFMESNEPPLAFTDDVDLVNHHHHITSSSSIPITNIPAVNIASSRKRQNSYGSGGGRQVGSASSRRRRVLSNALSNNTNNANKMPVNKRSRIVSGNSVTCKTSSYAGGESSSDEDSLHDNSVLIRPRRSNLSRNVRHNRSPGEDDLTRQHGEFDSDESNEPCMATERATLTSASNERCCVSYYRLRPNQRPQMSLDPIGREVLNTEYVSCPRFESELVEDDSADERDLDKPSINTTSNTHERGGGGRPNSAWPQIAGSTNRTNTMEELLGDDHIQLRSPGVPTATRIAGGGTGPGSIAPQEHLFQVEDERYEMDNVVDLNNYAIAELLTLKHRIQAKPQLAEFQPGNFSLEGSLGCSYASVYRGLHRLYGDRVDEIIHGVSVCPDRGVGLLLTRLKQKSREWGHVRRFFQRKWFDVTLNWHYRALDILGWSGKPRNEDYVQFRGRALLEDVVQHAKQQQSREMSGGNVEKSGSAATSGATDAPAVVAPAPAATAAATVASAAVHVNHHFSLTCACMKWPCASASSSTAASSIKPAGTAAAAVPQVNPIEDAVFLVVHSVRRIPNAYKDDKSIMKKIIRTAVPPLFHASPLPMSEDEAEEDDSIKATKKDVKKEDPMIVDISEDEPEQAMPAADPPTEAATTPNSLSAPPATAHNWWHGGPIDERRIEPLRQLIFGVGGYQKQLQHLELADYLARRTDCSGPHYVFYANDQWLLLLRLFHILYDRLCYFARLSEQMRLDDEVEKEQRDRVGAAINLEELMGRSLNPHFCQDRYRLFMHQLLELMDGAIENSAYEDMLRELFGIHAYRLYSLDKLISSLVKHLQNCALNDIGLALLSLQNHFRLESAKATTTPTEVEQLEKLYEQLALLVCNCPAILKATPQETNSSSSAHVGEHTTDPSTGEGSGINASAAAAPPTTSTDRASDQLQQQQHFLKETTVVSSGGDVKPPSRDAIFAPMMMMMPAITTDSKASSSSLLLTSQFLDDCKQNVSSCFRMIFLPNLSQLWIQLLDKITFDKSSSSKTMPNLSAAQSTLAKLHPVKQLPALDLNKEVHTWEDYLVRYLHLGMNNDNCPSPPQESSSIASSTTNNIPATTTAACSQATHDVAARCLYTKLRNVPLFRVQTVRKIILSIANTSPTEAAALAQAVKIKEESMDFEVVQEVKQTKEEEAVPLPEPPPPVIHLPEEMMKQEKSDSAFDSLSSPELLNMEIVNSGLKKDTCQLVKRIFRQDLMTERVFHNTFCTDRMERRDWSTARTLWSARSYGIFVRSCPLRSRKFQPSSDRFKQFHANWIQNNVSSTAALASNVDAIFQRLRETKEESV